MAETVKIKTRNLSFSYNGKRILRNTSIDFAENKIAAIVGPSGSGKSTFLLTLNRLWESIPNCNLEGRVEMKFGNTFHDIYQKKYPVTRLRRQVGMVFQAPNPLPMSIYKNVVFPLELAGRKDGEDARIMVEQCLKKVGLWGEVCDRLDTSALSLSGGQQQRLCIARAMMLQPEVLLLDEPTSSLDHKAAAAIEELLVDLKGQCTVLVVSHYLDQVQRIADSIVELQDGDMKGRSLVFAA
ncbi:MAG: ATP-binding cassette domain-containing protein [Desulfobulbaceae bacterium]|nr:ATP-binding cassette domain-containing protein [Desulfobulbaceae bacterium]